MGVIAIEPEAVVMPAVVNPDGAVIVRALAIAAPSMVIAEAPVALMIALSPRNVMFGVEIVSGRPADMV